MGGYIPFNFPWYNERSLSTVGLCEFAGTFLLAYVVAMSATVGVNDSVSAIAIGGAIIALCNVFGDGSGAHFNPCITIPVYLVERRFSGVRCGVYIVSQVCGAILGAQIAQWTANGLHNAYSWSSHAADNYSLIQLIVAEVIFTCFLAMTALLSAFVREVPSPMTPLWVAGAVIAASYSAGTVSGACLNPALSIAWVIAAGSAWDLVPYVIGEVLGCVFAAVLVMLMNPEICHRRLAYLEGGEVKQTLEAECTSSQRLI